MLNESLVLILEELDAQVQYFCLKEIAHILRGQDKDLIIDYLPIKVTTIVSSYSILIVWPLFLAELGCDTMSASGCPIKDPFRDVFEGECRNETLLPLMELREGAYRKFWLCGKLGGPPVGNNGIFLRCYVAKSLK